MSNSESVGKKIVEALRKQADSIEIAEETGFETASFDNSSSEGIISSAKNDDIFAEPEVALKQPAGFFDDVTEDDNKDLFFTEPTPVQTTEASSDNFEMPANIAVLKKLISQLPSGVSRHTGAQIIKQTMEALGISMKSVLQDAQQVQEGLKVSARECQASIQEYKKQILALEKQSQSYQKQYSALNDLISLFIQTTK